VAALCRSAYGGYTLPARSQPENIIVTKSGVKLLDFGLAKLRPLAPAVSGLSIAMTAPHQVTDQGTILGTLQYKAPE
jgi:serine/threonine protein kinase